MGVKSSVKKSQYFLNWTVEKFCELPYDVYQKSNIYLPIPGQTFCSIFQKCGKERTVWYLTFSQISGPKIEGSVNVNVCDSSGNKFYTLSKEGTFTKQDPSLIIVDKCVKIKEFLDSSKDDSITFKCVLELKECVTESWLASHPKLASETHSLSTLSEDFKTMYATPLYADIVLKLADGDLQVHKSVLCARSPVFAKMFESQMDENIKNSVRIADVEPTTMRNFVEFLYTGVVVRREFESLYNLYAVADKYDVRSLRKTCRDVLLSEMDVGNACRILVLADRHSDVEFKKEVMEYVGLNFDRILKSKVWDEFVVENIRLAQEVRERVQCKVVIRHENLI